jgi:hypothetical protein
MRYVEIHDLHAHLSEYLQNIREGEVILVTDRGEIVAELHPPSIGGELEAKYPGLVKMVRQGLVRLPVQPKDLGTYPHFQQVAPSGTAARLLDEDRGER